MSSSRQQWPFASQTENLVLARHRLSRLPFPADGKLAPEREQDHRAFHADPNGSRISMRDAQDSKEVFLNHFDQVVRLSAQHCSR
jgi:hypothetical protein